MIMNLHEAAATALAGVDLARNDRRRTSSRPRQMAGVAIVGSTAIDDFWADVYIEDFFVGTFYNTRGGVAQVNLVEDLRPVGPHYIPPGSQVSVVCGVNATGNPVNCLIQ